MRKQESERERKGKKRERKKKKKRKKESGKPSLALPSLHHLHGINHQVLGVCLLQESQVYPLLPDPATTLLALILISCRLETVTSS